MSFNTPIDSNLPMVVLFIEVLLTKSSFETKAFSFLASIIESATESPSPSTVENGGIKLSPSTIHSLASELDISIFEILIPLAKASLANSKIGIRFCSLFVRAFSPLTNLRLV